MTLTVLICAHDAVTMIGCVRKGGRMRRGSNIRMVLERSVVQTVQPGDRVSFKLHLFTNRPIEVHLWTVQFISKGKCTRFKAVGKHVVDCEVSVQECPFVETVVNIHAPPPAIKFYDPTPEGQDDQENDDAPKHLLVAPSEDNDNGPALSRFMTMRVPLMNVPDTWRYSSSVFKAKVTNILLASLTYRRTDRAEGTRGGRPRKLKARSVVTVKNGVMVERFAGHLPVEHQAQRVTGFPGCRGLIQCSLVARDQLVVQGYDLPLIVHITNDTALPVRRVTLTLYKETAFKDYNSLRQHVSMYTMKETVLKASLPRVPPRTSWRREIAGFTCPTDCMTSAGLLPCRFVETRFFVRLRVAGWPGSVKCVVQVHVGTLSSEYPVFEPTGLPVHHLPSTSAVGSPGIPGAAVRAAKKATADDTTAHDTTAHDTTADDTCADDTCADTTADDTHVDDTFDDTFADDTHADDTCADTTADDTQLDDTFDDTTADGTHADDTRTDTTAGDTCADTTAGDTHSGDTCADTTAGDTHSGDTCADTTAGGTHAADTCADTTAGGTHAADTCADTTADDTCTDTATDDTCVDDTSADDTSAGTIAGDTHADTTADDTHADDTCAGTTSDAMCADDANADDTSADNTQADDTNADNTQADDTNADDTSADNTQADDTNADDTSADNTQADDTNADDTSADNAQADDTNADDTSVDDTQADDTNADDTSADNAQADDTNADDTNADSNADAADAPAPPPGSDAD
ncbi:uncharacterized protein LOC143282217 [Babylonia areolata]|uniref:uncharacterized protein LOC143282217 n=1 Tax=Babylonia areolata TaxID=304850 RepID=UPI003FD58DAA